MRDKRVVLSYIAKSMIVENNEKSTEEIVLNNVMAYMKQLDIDPEDQNLYLKNTILYLHYEKYKNETIDKWVGTPALLGLIGTVMASSNGKTGTTVTLAIITTALVLAIGKMKQYVPNPYDENLKSLDDVRETEEIFRDAAPYIKRR